MSPTNSSSSGSPKTHSRCGTPPTVRPSVLITGGGGYVGRQLVTALGQMLARGEITAVVSTDVRETPADQRLPGVVYELSDVRAPGLDSLLKQHAITTVVHLASIVTPGKNHKREFEYSVDVEGSRNVLNACTSAGVRHIIVSSSGAAYGYHADSPSSISETDPIRGNPEIPYSWHKRLIEEMLADFRDKHPGLQQTILRIGTILGQTVKNQITDLFEKPRLIGIRGSDTPFVFIWDEDLVSIMIHAIQRQKPGIYNVAGDGALTIDEIGQRLKKPVLRIPAPVLSSALWVLRRLSLTQYGPEQIKFIRYRPVLDNQRLKSEFGYRPKKTSSEVFDLWQQSHPL